MNGCGWKEGTGEEGDTKEKNLEPKSKGCNVKLVLEIINESFHLAEAIAMSAPFLLVVVNL